MRVDALPRAENCVDSGSIAAVSKIANAPDRVVRVASAPVKTGAHGRAVVYSVHVDHSRDQSSDQVRPLVLVVARLGCKQKTK